MAHRPNTNGSRTSWEVLQSNGTLNTFFQGGETSQAVRDLLFDTRRDLTLLEEWADQVRDEYRKNLDGQKAETEELVARERQRSEMLQARLVQKDDELHELEQRLEAQRALDAIRQARWQEALDASHGSLDMAAGESAKGQTARANYFVQRAAVYAAQAVALRQ